MNFADLRNVFAAAAILAAAATSQNASATFTGNYGNNLFGGRVQLSANASHSRLVGATTVTETSAFAASARGDVRLNGVLREAAFARYDASSRAFSQQFFGRSLTSRSAASSLLVRIGGRTVVSQSATATHRYVASVTPGNVFAGSGAASSYTVGPFTVAVSAQASAGATYDATASLSLVPVEARLAGFVRTFANGRASTSVGVPGLRAGVSATLRMANNRTNLSLRATPTGVGGFFSWRTESIRLLVDLFAEMFPMRFTLSLVDISLGASTGARTLN